MSRCRALGYWHHFFSIEVIIDTFQTLALLIVVIYRNLPYHCFYWFLDFFLSKNRSFTGLFSVLVLDTFNTAESSL